MPSSSGCKEPKMHVPLRGAAIRMWRYQSSWGRYIYTAEGLGSDSASRPWSPAMASAPRASSVLHVLLASPQHPCLLRFPGSVMAPKMLTRPARHAMAVPPASGSRPRRPGPLETLRRFPVSMAQRSLAVWRRLARSSLCVRFGFLHSCLEDVLTCATV